MATTTLTELRVHTGNGSEEIKIDNQKTIGTLKKKLSEVTGIPPDMQSWVVAGQAFPNDNDDTIIGQAFTGSTTLHVKAKTQVSQVQSSNTEKKEGHHFKGTKTKDSDVHQGATFEDGHTGQEPERGKHKYEKTENIEGKLTQGDRYLAPVSLGKNNSDEVSQPASQDASQKGPPHQGSAYSKGQYPESDSSHLPHEGNSYLRTTTKRTNHFQGDEINPNPLSAPKGAGGDSFEDTDCEGGYLLQGNKFSSKSAN